VILVGAVTLAAGAGCGDRGSGNASGSDGVSVVAAVYPLAWVAERVAPQADVSLLTAGGLEAHDLDLTPRQRTAVERSDVILFLGDVGFQPQVEKAVTASSGQVVSLADVAGNRVLEGGPGGAHDEHGEEEEGKQAGKGVDPHMWLDPEIMADLAVRAGEAFAAADPERAATYRENAGRARDDLLALRAELGELLGGECRFDEAIVSHQAYAYLLRPYGHRQHAVTGINPEAGASSGKLAALVAEIRGEGIGHVLVEPVEGRKDAEVVAREAGVKLLDVSPLDAVTEKQARAGLPALVRQQATQFATALGCR
jgi:zinc transport system substrate-binding protein